MRIETTIAAADRDRKATVDQPAPSNPRDVLWFEGGSGDAFQGDLSRGRAYPVVEGLRYGRFHGFGFGSALRISRETFCVWKRCRASGEERLFEQRSHAVRNCRMRRLGGLSIALWRLLNYPRV